MAYINPLVGMLGSTEEQIINFFKNKRATTPNAAIEINFDKIKKSLEFPELIENNFSEFTFIKQTSDGKYYLDEISLKTETKLVKKIFATIFIVVIVTLILFVIFSFF